MMTQHIIDTVSKLKKECDVMCGDSPHDVRIYNEAIDDALQAIRALIASSPQADDVRKDAERLDWIEKKFCGLSDSDRYLPFRLSWGKGNKKTLREAIDKAKQGSR